MKWTVSKTGRQTSPFKKNKLYVKLIEVIINGTILTVLYTEARNKLLQIRKYSKQNNTIPNKIERLWK